MVAWLPRLNVFNFSIGYTLLARYSGFFQSQEIMYLLKDVFFSLENQNAWRSVKELPVWGSHKGCSSFTPDTLSENLFSHLHVHRKHTHTHTHEHTRVRTHTYTEHLINIPFSLVSVHSDCSNMLSISYESEPLNQNGTASCLHNWLLRYFVHLLEGIFLPWPGCQYLAKCLSCRDSPFCHGSPLVWLVQQWTRICTGHFHLWTKEK